MNSLTQKFIFYLLILTLFFSKFMTLATIFPCSIKTPVPTWVLQAKHELFYQPATILRTKYTNLLNTTVLDHGGHFIAFEQPAILAQDVFTAVTEFRRWHEEQSKAKTEL